MLYETKDRTLMWNQEEGLGQPYPNQKVACLRMMQEWDSVDAVYRHDAQLWEIVRNEAERFFSRQLSVSEAPRQYPVPRIHLLGGTELKSV